MTPNDLRSMTPEQRASEAVQAWYAEHSWRYDPNQHAELERQIAATIRAAVAEEREACYQIACEESGQRAVRHYKIGAAVVARRIQARGKKALKEEGK